MKTNIKFGLLIIILLLLPLSVLAEEPKSGLSGLVDALMRDRLVSEALPSEGWVQETHPLFGDIRNKTPFGARMERTIREGALYRALKEAESRPDTSSRPRSLIQAPCGEVYCSD